MEYFVISAKFVPLKYYTLSSQLWRLTLFSVGCSGRRILSPGQIAVMRKWSIDLQNNLHYCPKLTKLHTFNSKYILLETLFIPSSQFEKGCDTLIKLNVGFREHKLC